MIAGLYRFSRMAAQLQSTSIHIDLRMMKLTDTQSAMDRLSELLVKMQYNLDFTPEVNVILDMGAKANVEILERMVIFQTKTVNIYHSSIVVN